MVEYLSLSHIMQHDESIAKQFINWSDLYDSTSSNKVEESFEDLLEKEVDYLNEQFKPQSRERKNELESLEMKQNELKNQYNKLQERVDSLSAALKAVEKEIDELEEEQEPLEWELATVNGKIEQLRSALEQESAGEKETKQKY